MRFDKRNDSQYHLRYPFDYGKDFEDVIVKDMIEFAERQKENNDIPLFSFDKYRLSEDQLVYSNKMDVKSAIGLHRHDFFEINFTISGNCYQYIGDELIVMEPNDLLLMFPSVAHANYPPIDSFAVNILIDTRLMEAIAEKIAAVETRSLLSELIAKKSYTIISVKNDKHICELIEDIYNRFSYHDFKSRSLYEMLIESEIEQLFVQLMISLGSGNAEQKCFGASMSEGKAERILTFIRDNFATLDMAKLCARFGYSERQMRRIIRRYAGCGFCEYIVRLRHNRATHLLMRTSLSVDEIASAVGMEKTSFCRFIKRTTGLSPLNFRKAHRNETDWNYR